MTDRTDDFNRANDASALGTPSDSGSAWVAASGTWGISSNAGYNPSAGGNVVAYLESSVADADVQVTTSVMSGDVGLTARLTDNSNYLLFITTLGTGFRMYKKVAGSFTQIGSTAAGTPASGDVLKFTVNGTSLTGYINGVSKVSTTESHNSSATKHGLRANADSASRFDTFSITGLGGGGGGPIGPLIGGRLVGGGALMGGRLVR